MCTSSTASRIHREISQGFGDKTCQILFENIYLEHSSSHSSLEMLFLVCFMFVVVCLFCISKQNVYYFLWEGIQRIVIAVFLTLNVCMMYVVYVCIMYNDSVSILTSVLIPTIWRIRPWHNAAEIINLNLTIIFKGEIDDVKPCSVANSTGKQEWSP